MPLWLPSVGEAQWLPEGLPLCRAQHPQDLPRIASDGRGGAFIVWRDTRFLTEYPDNLNDLFMQRVTAAGTVAPNWPEDGQMVGVGRGYQAPLDILEDGHGGAFVVW